MNPSRENPNDQWISPIYYIHWFFWIHPRAILHLITLYSILAVVVLRGYYNLPFAVYDGIPTFGQMIAHHVLAPLTIAFIVTPAVMWAIYWITRLSYPKPYGSIWLVFGWSAIDFIVVRLTHMLVVEPVVGLFNHPPLWLTNEQSIVWAWLSCSILATVYREYHPPRAG